MNSDIPIYLHSQLLEAIDIFSKNLPLHIPADTMLQNIFLRTVDDKLQIEHKPSSFKKHFSRKFKDSEYNLAKNADTLSSLLVEQKTSTTKSLSDLTPQQQKSLLSFARSCRQLLSKSQQQSFLKRLFSRSKPSADMAKIKEATRKILHIIDLTENNIVKRCYEQLKGPEASEAISTLHAEAQKGNIHAKRLLGKCYLEGKGVSSDVSKGKNLLTQAAEGGSRRAMVDLAYFSQTISENHDEWFSWMMKASPGYDRSKDPYIEYQRLAHGYGFVASDRALPVAIELEKIALTDPEAADCLEALFDPHGPFFADLMFVHPEFVEKTFAVLMAKESSRTAREKLELLCNPDERFITTSSAKAPIVWTFRQKSFLWFLAKEREGVTNATENVKKIISIVVHEVTEERSVPQAFLNQVVAYLIQQSQKGDLEATKTLKRIIAIVCNDLTPGKKIDREFLNKAEEWLKEQSDKGDIIAKSLLAYLYDERSVFQKSREEILSLYREVQESKFAFPEEYASLQERIMKKNTTPSSKKPLWEQGIV